MSRPSLTDPIIHYVDLLLEQALQADASDLHIEPFEHECKVRYRIDGTLYEMKPLPASFAQSIVSRLKVMARLDIAERRLPQDGRIEYLFSQSTEDCEELCRAGARSITDVSPLSFSAPSNPCSSSASATLKTGPEKVVGKTSVDFRLSTLPTQFGESLVLRVLDRRKINLTLQELQMPMDIEKAIITTIKKNHGIFIVTGPTGSGKTTTLYSCLQQIHESGSKLLTAEDPIEYEMDGIMQVPINDAIGLSFASLLRSFLRQDPDVIMIGETRDAETAHMALQASLTGHLVLTTLHTNDASGAISRLIDMGLEPLIIATSLEAVLAQRLVRKICDHCRVTHRPEEEVLSLLKISEYGEKQFYRGQGCDVCHQTGYRGRIGLFELLVIGDPLRTLIHERAPHLEIQKKARELGMKTLREHGIERALEGVTTLEEVVKWT